MPGSSTSDSISTVLVPLGDLDYFGVQHFVDAASAHMDEMHRLDSVTVDLSAVAFCDSSIGSLMDWVDGLPDECGVTVVTGSAVDRVLDLLPEACVRRSRCLTPAG